MLMGKPPRRKWRVPVSLRIIAVLALIGCGFAVWFAVVRQRHAESIRGILEHAFSHRSRNYCPVWLSSRLDPDWRLWFMEVESAELRSRRSPQSAERAVLHMQGLRNLPEIAFFDMAINDGTLAHLREVR